MSDTFKRTFTDGDKVAFAQLDVPNNSETPPDLTAQLRNVGSRIRKSVTEGYITPPSSRVFAKAQSTTTIFTSAKDINRDVFALKPSRQTRADPAQPHKRSRSVSDHGSETEPEDQDNSNIVTSDQFPASTIKPQSHQIKDDRVIKPLKKNRGIMQTRSLPVGAFRFFDRPTNPTPAMASTTEEEEDWSFQPSNNVAQPSFEPVVFD